MSESQERSFTRAMVLVALSRLGRQLETQGLEGDVYLVGGAAMALVYEAERFTRDIDAVFAPTTEIYDAAEVVGEELNLPAGWLNDAAKGFVPGLDPARRQVLEMPGLRVTAASPEFLLGMKLLAARVDRDREDIRRLAAILDLSTSDQVLALVERLYPVGQLLSRTRFLVEEMFPPTHPGRPGDRPAPSRGSSGSPHPRRSRTGG